jgi:hypothetical protein
MLCYIRIDSDKSENMIHHMPTDIITLIMGLLDVSARTRLNIALPKTKKIIMNDQMNKKIGLITKALGKCGGPEAFYRTPYSTNLVKFMRMHMDDVSFADYAGDIPRDWYGDPWTSLISYLKGKIGIKDVPDLRGLNASAYANEYVHEIGWYHFHDAIKFVCNDDVRRFKVLFEDDKTSEFMKTYVREKDALVIMEFICERYDHIFAFIASLGIVTRDLTSVLGDYVCGDVRRIYMVMTYFPQCFDAKALMMQMLRWCDMDGVEALLEFM